jgi:hypothetical protein
MPIPQAFAEARRSAASTRAEEVIPMYNLRQMRPGRKVRELERRSGIRGLFNYYGYLVTDEAFRVHEFIELVDQSLADMQWEVFLHTPWSDAIKYIEQHYDYTQTVSGD